MIENRAVASASRIPTCGSARIGFTKNPAAKSLHFSHVSYYELLFSSLLNLIQNAFKKKKKTSLFPWKFAFFCSGVSYLASDITDIMILSDFFFTIKLDNHSMAYCIFIPNILWQIESPITKYIHQKSTPLVCNVKPKKMGVAATGEWETARKSEVTSAGKSKKLSVGELKELKAKEKAEWSCTDADSGVKSKISAQEQSEKSKIRELPPARYQSGVPVKQVCRSSALTSNSTFRLNISVEQNLFHNFDLISQLSTT